MKSKKEFKEYLYKSLDKNTLYEVNEWFSLPKFDEYVELLYTDTFEVDVEYVNEVYNEIIIEDRIKKLNKI